MTFDFYSATWDVSVLAVPLLMCVGLWLAGTVLYVNVVVSLCILANHVCLFIVAEIAFCLQLHSGVLLGCGGLCLGGMFSDLANAAVSLCILANHIYTL